MALPHWALHFVRHHDVKCALHHPLADNLNRWVSTRTNNSTLALLRCSAKISKKTALAIAMIEVVVQSL